MYPMYYHTENKETDFLLAPEIESDIIQTDILKVFIPVFRNEKSIREKNCVRADKTKNE
ncbi:hypothetical protein ACWGOQ_0016960 [Aquimarina sp. M1]